MENILEVLEIYNLTYDELKLKVEQKMKEYKINHQIVDNVLCQSDGEQTIIYFVLKSKLAKRNPKEGYVFCYGYNLDHPDFSEFGDVYLTVLPDGRYSI